MTSYMVEKFDRFSCHMFFTIFYVFVIRLYNNCKNIIMLRERYIKRKEKTLKCCIKEKGKSI